MIVDKVALAGREERKGERALEGERKGDTRVGRASTDSVHRFFASTVLCERGMRRQPTPMAAFRRSCVCVTAPLRC